MKITHKSEENVVEAPPPDWGLEAGCVPVVHLGRPLGTAAEPGNHSLLGRV